MADRQIQGFGWKPSLTDQRDLLADTSEITVADQVDPRADLPEVYDQAHLGSCTANAVAGALEYNNRLDGDDYGTPSRLFIYYFERRYEGSTADQDTGAFGRDGHAQADRDLPFGPPQRRLLQSRAVQPTDVRLRLHGVRVVSVR